jgi:NlpC/P60 family putative phage cell wall peptidase
MFFLSVTQRTNLAMTPTGDVILFRMRAGAIAKHVGILSGQSRFIHAYERTGVIEEHLTPAWQRRIAFVFRFPER